MQKAFDLIKERLEEEIEWYTTHGINEDLNRGIIGANRHAIGIVNQVAEEYKSHDGWIPCSERLPEIAGHEVLATLENTVGQRRVTVIFTGYGLTPFWHCNHKEFDLNHWKVVAWKELPAPYKPKGE